MSWISTGEIIRTDKHTGLKSRLKVAPKARTRFGAGLARERMLLTNRVLNIGQPSWWGQARRNSSRARQSAY